MHSTTGYSPHELAHGFKIKIPAFNSNTVPETYDNYVREVSEHISKACKIAGEKLTKRKNVNKLHYDRDVNDIEIQENDLILIRNQQPNKFSSPYNGPYRVVRVDKSYVEYKKGGKTEKNPQKSYKKVHCKIRQGTSRNHAYYKFGRNRIN